MTFSGFCHSARAGSSKRATSLSKSAWCMNRFAAVSCTAQAGCVCKQMHAMRIAVAIENNSLIID